MAGEDFVLRLSEMAENNILSCDHTPTTSFPYKISFPLKCKNLPFTR